MMSEIAVEQAMRPVFHALEEELAKADCGIESPNRCRCRLTQDALLRIADVALKQFEWSTPEWALEIIEKYRKP